MSFEKELICPTLEEIDLLRKKFNSIVDIPYIKEVKSKNYLYFNNTKNLEPSKNHDEIINQLNRKIYELENILNSNSYKIDNYDNLLNENKELNILLTKLKGKSSNNNNNLSNYDLNEDEDNNMKRKASDQVLNIKNIGNNNYNDKIQYNYNNENFNKLKYNNSEKDLNNNILKKEGSYNNINNESEPEIIKRLINSNRCLNTEVEKLKRELYLSSKQNTSNKEILANYIQEILNEHKGEFNAELIKFLLDRIDKLEYQNYFLASKMENYIIIMNQFIEELCEYIDIIFDLGNVINDIPENIIRQNINEDFFIVRDTLNNKKDMLSKKYEEYNNFKNNLNTNDALKNNDVLLMIGNKINDLNTLINDDKISKDFSQIIDEKMKKYENLMNKINSEDNNNFIEKELIITNNILEKKNSELRQIIKEIFANDKSNKPLINSKIKEKLISILNDNNSSKGNNIMISNFCAYEDLLMMLNAQCYLNEILMNQDNMLNS